MLSIGVDAWNLPGDHRGIGRYVREILREWRSMPDRATVTLIVPEWHTWTVRGRYLREVDDVPYRIVSRAMHRFAGLDVLWFPWNGCSWTNFSLPAVATLHDATNFVIPGYAPETQKIFRAAVEHCTRLITVSEFSRQELIRVLHIPPDRITAIPSGVRFDNGRALGSIDTRTLKPYVLFVGMSEKRKGVEALLRAMQRVQARHPEVSLVLAGARGDAIDGSETVRLRELGWIDDATLASLYRDASVFAFPSRYEGFGLPALEAMTHGTPVVTTSNTAIPEAAGDAALYIPVDDENALANAILRILDDPNCAAALRERGLRRAAEMAWTKTAIATLDVLQKATQR
ncbi:MAG: glycosyltransferase family 4 protein [Candidatus Eremiobacteraeota bacterium]|nr:glycosyltransferase family 4 protein [Candidatus Eremiobacteraeota bacterium]